VRVIPVLDLNGGRAVHSRGGRREHYAPVQSKLARPAGDAVALARAYRDVLGSTECYLADLDAISGAEPQWTLLRAITAQGARWLVDAACTTTHRAREILDTGGARVVVGLETLSGFAALASLCRAMGRDRVVFSLDLYHSKPLIRAGAAIPGGPVEIAREAASAGVAALLMLDLARVGSGGGIDLALARRIRNAHPTLELLAGGGVEGEQDLERAAQAGLDGVLVATALHDGRIGAAQIQATGRGA
jgi:phosphoribosylformimino-5-aminoimidazole carboxamide ribotide isomerase